MIGVELTGWLGALAVLLAFALLTSRRVTAFAPTYVILNVAGSAGLAINGIAHSAWPSVVLNLLWLVIAVLAVRIGRRQQIVGQVSDAEQGGGRSCVSEFVTGRSMLGRYRADHVSPLMLALGQPNRPPAGKRTSQPTT